MWQSFVNIFLTVLLFIYKLVGNFGVAIILFTILIKLLTYPLMRSQMKSSAAMMELNNSPEYKEMMEKYKDDKEKLAAEQMKLYKKAGVNPTASCLPMFVQLPVIFALYQAIIAAIVSTPLGMLDLTKRIQGTFLKIGEIFPINPNFLWMNIGLPERLHISGLSFGIPVLAILVVISTVLQTKLTLQSPTGGSTQQAGGAGMMSGMMNIYMPLLMGWMAWSLASGLALYFLISNIFTIAQYGIEGKLDWKNLKFSKPDFSTFTKPPQPKREALSQKSDRKDIPEKIDYREFKNKKKPKKQQ